MPLLILWAVPAILVVGGGIYLIGHMHQMQERQFLADAQTGALC